MLYARSSPVHQTVVTKLHMDWTYLDALLSGGDLNMMTENSGLLTMAPEELVAHIRPEFRPQISTGFTQ